MPIDVNRVVGTEFGQSEVEWGPDQVILYHLGIGAGNPPTSPNELAYTYEGDNLRVVPSFATIPPFTSMLGVSESVASISIWRCFCTASTRSSSIALCR